MDAGAVNLGIAANADVIDGLNCYGMKPDSIVEPAFFPRQMVIVYDETMGRGQDKISGIWHLLVSRADDEAGQAVLNAYLKGAGSTSLKAAIQADRALAGACVTLRVTKADAHRMITVGADQYYGAEISIDVYGRGD